METKEMTQEEAFEFLKNTKVLCTSTEETKKVQKKLFELNYKFVSGFQAVKEDIYLLYIYNSGVLQYGTDLGAWMSDTARKMEPSEILSLQLKEEEPKFDPNILQPFDKVLVREEGYRWIARFFDIYDGGYCTTSGHVWTFCIPFNEETKHLHGTTEEAPEFYRI